MQRTENSTACAWYCSPCPRWRSVIGKMLCSAPGWTPGPLLNRHVVLSRFLFELCSVVVTIKLCNLDKAPNSGMLCTKCSVSLTLCPRSLMSPSCFASRGHPRQNCELSCLWWSHVYTLAPLGSSSQGECYLISKFTLSGSEFMMKGT